MNNRIILKILISIIMLAGAGVPAFAGSFIEIPAQQPEEINVVSETIILNEPEIAPSADAIPESKIARRMTQAEKAENASVNDGWGGAITIIAMCIVITALAVLSLLFLCFGKISESIIRRKTKRAKQAAAHVHDDSHHDLAPGEVIAAIALALSEHFGEGHDMEDTILTIRRMKKAYSPWNSKIYNLRTIPEHHRNSMPMSAVSNS